MAVTLSNSEIDDILREAQEAVASEGEPDSDEKINKALEMVQFTKEVLEAEIKSMQEDIESKLAYLVENSAIKVELARRMRATKVVMASIAISLSSLAFGIRCRPIAEMRDALPWAFGLSVTCLLFSFIYCKGIWRNSKIEPVRKTVENSAEEVQEPPTISADSGREESSEPVSSVANTVSSVKTSRPKEKAQRRVYSV